MFAELVRIHPSPPPEAAMRQLIGPVMGLELARVDLATRIEHQDFDAFFAECAGDDSPCCPRPNDNHIGLIRSHSASP